MDEKTFDRFTRRFSTAESRRAALRLVFGTVFGGLVVADQADGLALAAKRKKKRRDGKKGRDQDGHHANARGGRRDDRRQGKKKKKKNKKGNRPVATLPPADPGTGSPPPPPDSPPPPPPPPCVVDDCPDPGPCQTKQCVNNTCSPQPMTDGTIDNRCGAGERCCGGACKQCCTVADCTAPSGGTVTCTQGFCSKRCTNSLHRVCGSNPGVCQECCNDSTDKCNIIHPDSTCVGGACQCPNGLTRCGMECVDTSLDPNHCGACNTKCPSGTCQNSACWDLQPCDNIPCNPQHDPDCDPFECAPKHCISQVCVCSPGWIDCNADGECESCGRCGVESCPPNPENNEPGRCCPGGFCSCGGSCEAGCETCWVTSTRQNEDPVITREVCDPGCVDCWGMCCTGCINGECASSGPIGGGRIRR